MGGQGRVMSHDNIILATDNLTKEFAGFVAVAGVNLTVTRGTIHALIGPNGAGKTTCFNLLTKFLRPTQGRIVFNGRDITTLAPADVARLGIVPAEGRSEACSWDYGGPSGGAFEVFGLDRSASGCRIAPRSEAAKALLRPPARRDRYRLLRHFFKLFET